jgi:hypothetical protein
VGKELSFHYPARSEANGAGSAESTKSRAGTARLFTLSDGRSRWAVPTLPGWAAMHRAKGLEFKVVIVMGCDEDMLPRASVLDEMVDEADRAAFVEQERQLLYVACTRARERLFLTYSGRPKYRTKTSKPRGNPGISR